MITIFNGRQLSLDGTEDVVYAQVSVALRDKIHLFNTGRNCNPFAVFMALALHADRDGWAWPSRDKLTQETGIKSAIGNSIKHLCDMEVDGHRVLECYRERRTDGQWSRTLYRIFPDAWQGDAKWPERFKPQGDMHCWDPNAPQPPPHKLPLDKQGLDYTPPKDPHVLELDPVLKEKEPPTADSPVEDSQDDSDADVYVSDWTPRTGSRDDMSTADADDISRDGILLPGEIPQDPADDSAETASMFKDPKPSPHEPVEQGKARRRNELGTDPLQVAAVVAQNRAAAAHPDGGDASKDGDPWMGRPVKEWCAFIRLPYENSRVAYLATELSHIAVEVHASAEQTGEAIRKMTLSPSCEWLRTAHDPKHTGFAGTLLNVLNGQELPEGKAGGASGGRNDPPQVDQAVAETMARLFDENGVRIRRE